MGRESRFSREVGGFLVGDWCGESAGVASGCVVAGRGVSTASSLGRGAGGTGPCAERGPEEEGASPDP